MITSIVSKMDLKTRRENKKENKVNFKLNLCLPSFLPFGLKEILHFYFWYLSTLKIVIKTVLVGAKYNLRSFCRFPDMLLNRKERLCERVFSSTTKTLSCPLPFCLYFFSFFFFLL